MKKNKKVKIIKVILLILFLLLLVGLIIYLMPVMKKISTREGQIEFKEKIEDAGPVGVVILLGLQIAQIFLIVLPGEPLEILAGMCYGSIYGTIFIFASVFLTTTIIFFLVKRYKKRFLYEFFSKEKIDKIENSKIFKNPKKAEMIFAILFLIPGTPKDLLVYLGGLFNIKPLRFILISTFVRFPSVISSTMAGDSLIQGKWQMSLIIYAITFVITGIILFIINKLDKNKITKSALETIK